MCLNRIDNRHDSIIAETNAGSVVLAGNWLSSLEKSKTRRATRLASLPIYAQEIEQMVNWAEPAGFIVSRDQS